MAVVMSRGTGSRGRGVLGVPRRQGGGVVGISLGAVFLPRSGCETLGLFDHPAHHPSGAPLRRRDVDRTQMALQGVPQRQRSGGGVVTEAALAALGSPHPEAKLSRPLHLALEGGTARRGGGPHPSRGVELVFLAPVLPRQVLGHALVIDEQFVLGVDGVVAVGEGELHQLGLGDRLGGTRLHAHVAVDTAQKVDLVDVAVPLTGGHRMVGRIVEAAHIDAVGGADTRTQFAADAFLRAVLVLVEDVATMLARLLGPLLFGVLAGDRLTPKVLEGQLESTQEVLGLLGGLGCCHQASSPSVGEDTDPAGDDAVGTSGRFHNRRPTWGRIARVSPRWDPTRKDRVISTLATTTVAVMARPHQPSITKPATMRSQPRDNGISRFQPRSMSWSYRSRGSAARSQTERKNRANRIDEYSVTNPPTNSESASTRSKGGRLVSATMAMKKITKGMIPSRMAFHCQRWSAWPLTMSRVVSDPVIRTTITTVMPSAAS